MVAHPGWGSRPIGFNIGGPWVYPSGLAVLPERQKGSTMQYVEAPKQMPVPTGMKVLFLAGGITNCPDWQKELVDKLGHIQNLLVLNPRRKNFPIHDPDASLEQIRWEHQYLRVAGGITFWFARGSLNPIVLFEYGKELGRREGEHHKELKQLFVGCDPEYERIRDVKIQTGLENRDIEISTQLARMVERIHGWCLKEE